MSNHVPRSRWIACLHSRFPHGEVGGRSGHRPSWMLPPPATTAVWLSSASIVGLKNAPRRFEDDRTAVAAVDKQGCALQPRPTSRSPCLSGVRGRMIHRSIAQTTSARVDDHRDAPRETCVGSERQSPDRRRRSTDGDPSARPANNGKVSGVDRQRAAGALLCAGLNAPESIPCLVGRHEHPSMRRRTGRLPGCWTNVDPLSLGCAMQHVRSC
jgi:hypothetical protein